MCKTSKQSVVKSGFEKKNDATSIYPFSIPCYVHTCKCIYDDKKCNYAW